MDGFATEEGSSRKIGRGNEWAGIVIGNALGIPSLGIAYGAVVQSAKIILANLNGRTCTDSGATVPCPGAGFQITNN
ncbi:hypothetical protein [Rhodococcus tukisamuensis]|uniref:Uncharacterized protein n=1 Tax=Rhodococcus tukisamuensis TaxID=168276 RepID=A0A1G7ETV0_9NOCA|nr:hypothetical protein [Rhodococcus tukisamuensis]SDE66865.1 hypothetical protein SAMN05444580_1273 [Rhodococcus tukisamuensis]